MRILIHSAPPYAQSGYGTQCRFMAAALAELGHEVAVSCYAGVHEEREWNGIQLLGTGGKAYGNGVIAGNYKRWNADLVITLMDIFTLVPEQFAGLVVFPWVPVDVEPIGVMDRRWLDTVGKIAELHPIAMSGHAQKMLAEVNISSVVVPMATDYKPDLMAGVNWRHALGLSSETFLIVKVGVNNEDDRKAFGVTEQAFSAFLQRHKGKTGLYLHCEAQAKGAPNLAFMALNLGLKNHIAFCDEYKRACDLFTADYMHGLYCAADVLDATSKGEGFGVPIVEALACGTPVIGARNSAVPEKLDPSYSWLVSGQREWAKHHQSWWSVPSVAELTRAYEKAYNTARRMRSAAAAAGARWTPEAMRDALAAALG